MEDVDIENYLHLASRPPSLAELLVMPEGDDIEFAPARLRDPLARPLDLD